MQVRTPELGECLRGSFLVGAGRSSHKNRMVIGGMTATHVHEDVARELRCPLTQRALEESYGVSIEVIQQLVEVTRRARDFRWTLKTAIGIDPAMGIGQMLDKTALMYAAELAICNTATVPEQMNRRSKFETIFFKQIHYTQFFSFFFNLKTEKCSLLIPKF